ncbi:hypothetical protein PHJA_001550400 [Phtheirospermum japonicum]|uniref:C2 NT-type domain-containing protein n=1 Tax=Phtheirospermum japonicum TaxID=374723 RepID=A0A830C372_9LAMI|nr:hypothetical protein PHJA_001550400 [Phtheirospermum japonicum]
MVQSPRTKTRKTPSLQLDYTIHIHEIKPWPPSQSLKTIRAVLIQWEHGDRNSGLTNQVVPSIEDGKIEFNESFKLPVTLIRDKSIKTGNGHTFTKNCVELNLYEPRRDKTVKKGQLIGTAVLDLAEYGVVRESLGLSVPINCKRTYGNSAQPVMFLNIQSVERTRAGSSSRDGLIREGSSNFEEFVEETENGTVAINGNASESEQTPCSSLVDLSSDLARISKKTTSPNLQSSALEDIEKSSSNIKVNEHEADNIQENVTQIDFIDDEASGKHQKYTKPEIEEKIAVNGTFSNIDRSKHVKSVRSSLDSSRSNGPVRNNQFSMKEPKNGLSDTRVQHLENRMKVLEGELREAAAIEVSLYSVIAEHGSSTNKVHAPARRLSRLYFHASKLNSKSRRGSAAKSIVSGLVLVSKACGNDVPRLTFWLSNTIVLRVIMSKSFGDGKSAISVGPVTGTAGNANKKLSPLKWESVPSKSTRSAIEESFGEWENPQTFVAALEKSGNAKEIHSSLDSESSMLFRRTSSSIDQQHESADEIPTDPVADPISDAEVLPIPAGKASFGAGAQLKNAIGNWSRWLTDLFGIDDDDLLEDADETIPNDTSSKSFHLLNALSDLMMLPKDLLLSRTVRKEVCPTFGPPIIRRVLSYFVPDEFCPDPIPNVVLEALNSEDSFGSEDNSIMNFPCAAAPTVYQPPTADSVASILGEFDSHSQLTRSRSSVLKKSQTSDDELDELDSPLKSIILDGVQAPPSPVKPSWMSKENGSRNALRYQLLRDVWTECD